MGNMKVLLLAFSLAALTTTVAAQSKPTYQPPRNIFGQPDFSGTLSLNSLTKLERPRNVTNLVLTPSATSSPTSANTTQLCRGW